MSAIEVRGLKKSYVGGDGSTIDAVRGIDLTLEDGEILAFLGANGAGKTTTIEILEGFRTRSAGEVKVLGVDPQTAPLSWREDIGIVLQESEPEVDLTAREALQKYSAYYRAPRPVDEVLEIVGLAEHGDQRNKVLSGGQKRRLDLAVALIGDPKVIFLDEPTTGFDPSARRDAWGMIEGLRATGASVLLTTHYMDEAESLADRIVVISSGSIIAEGTATDLASQVSLRTAIGWDLAEAPLADLPDRLVDLATVSGDRASVETDDVTAVLGELIGWAKTNGVRLDSLSVVRPNLEETFLRLTGSGDAENQVDPGSAPTGGPQ